MPGGCDHSYGIQVAKLAGLPSAVIERAKHRLYQLENNAVESNAAESSPQLSLFTHNDTHPAITALQECNLDDLTPKQALDELYRLKGLADYP